MSSPLRWDTDGAGWPHHDAGARVQSGGLRWHVQTHRHADPQAPCIALLHGTGASTHSWRDLIPLLAPHATVLALDLPGHGFTDMPTQEDAAEMFSLPGMARGVGSLLAALGVVPAMLVGHSAGAAIALRMCLDAQASPRCVVSLNGALAPFDGVAGKLFSPLAKMLARQPWVPQLFAWRAGSPRVLDQLLDGTGSRLDAQGRALYRRLISNPVHAAGALGMMAHWDLQSLWDDLPRLRTPVHFIVGANDLIVLPEVSRRAAAVLGAQQQVQSLPGLGHLAHEERPDLVAALLLPLLEGNT